MKNRAWDDLNELADMDMKTLMSGVGDDLDLHKWFAELEVPDLSALWADIDLSDLILPAVQSGPARVPECPD